ncbi:hypothetical protein ID866_5725 [Astraeus odoratus]|nr:hypothetical protein ID866_5725 [Astraeus odoratus]
MGSAYPAGSQFLASGTVVTAFYSGRT